MSRYMKQLACRFHPESVLIEDYRAGDMICPDCGLVVGDRMIDVGSEWRTFSVNDGDQKDMSRVGSLEEPLFDGLDSFATVMRDPSTRDKFGKGKYRSEQMSTKERVLRNGFGSIQAIGAKVNLEKRITERAKVIFKQYYEQKHSNGRNYDTIAAACIYIACREQKMPRTFKEICAISHSSTKGIARCYKQLIETLSKTPEATDLKSLVPRFCNHLGFKKEKLIQKTAQHIVEKASELCNIQSRSPTAIVGACIYMAAIACGEERPLKDIQQATSATTIRQAYQILLTKVTELFPQDFQFNVLPSDFPTLSNRKAKIT
ncbi:unnamed protein product [Didymodactylos carnosus]|uniref:Transcription initiation factor IIB n=1 Tax=Didymodactylos carnosus TaxID=1234261 RepID=A0A813VM74_9BILA|nr:unnamed protein product [Didymodactylos carnosus]CAF0895027.1 unnamed protein product [Didymodactylos carnosus]CAF3630033.1 unnamed protein product [Didymodactylos carnosus]CAF3676664.1 unnamed protein product [Didymodactylos carnosus]